MRFQKLLIYIKMAKNALVFIYMIKKKKKKKYLEHLVTKRITEQN